MKIGMGLGITRRLQATAGDGLYRITATANAGGTIEPSGVVTVEPGGRQAFSVTPASGYYVSSLLVDGVPSDLPRWWEFSNVQANHSIAATFAAKSSPLVQRDSGFSLGFIGCSHITQGILLGDRMARLTTGLQWLVANAPDLKGLIALGDMTVSPTVTEQLPEWLYDNPEDGPSFPTSIPLLPVIGNHDAELTISSAHGITPAAPHATCVARFPTLFRGREWYAWDCGSARVIVLNNLTDYLKDNGETAYHNCNPPGAEYELNPDHSGITIEGSPQRSFLAAAMQGGPPLKIVCTHRPAWAPYDDDPRKLHRAFRAVLRDAIDAGATLHLSADIHVGSHSGPWYPTEPDNEEARANGAVGIHAVTVASGYFIRAMDDAVLPDHATTCHWASGSQVDQHVVHVGLLEFRGDEVWMTIYELDEGDAVGRIAHQYAIKRNPGA